MGRDEIGELIAKNPSLVLLNPSRIRIHPIRFHPSHRGLIALQPPLSEVPRVKKRESFFAICLLFESLT
jgi:hypothetical protein